MPETVILDPHPEYDPEIEDSMVPNYGFTKKRPLTSASVKSPGGSPYVRETQNTGHQFTFSWTSRSWKCVQRLKRFYEQYEDGYFTIIDHDGGGRHYVGRFTSEVNPVQTANLTWDVQSVTFEEMPRVPMLKYPNDWANDAIRLYPHNDWGDLKLATDDNGNWLQTTRNIGGTERTTMDNAGTNAGDWAAYEYRGYGFRLWMLKGPEYGSFDLTLDGTTLATINCNTAVEMGPQIVWTHTKAMLDIHRVMIKLPGPAAVGDPSAVSWFALEVMR